MGLVGRSEECQILDGLLDTARQGLSRTLVIRGEPGVGKTALLEYAIRAADDFLVVRFVGVEPERDLPYAALHRLLVPILHQIERLPEPQRTALNSALGLAPGPPADRFLVGLGTISLAANAARARERLLCVIDDAQWIDRESLEALAFWGRRIHAEGIVLIFAERDSSEFGGALQRFDAIELDGLGAEAAATLFLNHANSDVDAEGVGRVIADTNGNPLALIELAKDLTPEILMRAAAIQDALPVSKRLEERFAAEVRTLPVDTQMLLLVVAAESSGDPGFLQRATSRLGISGDAARQAEDHNLLVLGPHVTFRHPLIRSAVYSGARPADRRAIHRALAESAADIGDEDRHAWHLAAAIIGADDEVAELLARRSGLAASRGAHSAAAALLDRAAELTTDADERAKRRVLGAQAAIDANAPVQAQAFIEAARHDTTDPYVLAQADRVEAQAWRSRGHAAKAADLYLSAARGLLAHDTTIGRRTLLEALESARMVGPQATDVRDSAAKLALASGGPANDSLIELLLAGLATDALAGYEEAVAPFRAIAAAMTADDADLSEMTRFAALGSNVTRALWDYTAHDELMKRIVRVARSNGSLGALQIAYQSLATTSFRAGRFNAADGYLAQAADIGRATALHPMLEAFLGVDVAAARGDADRVRMQVAQIHAIAEPLGHGMAQLYSHVALTLLGLGVGHYEDAFEHARIVYDADLTPHNSDILPELIEAASRCGDAALAQQALAASRRTSGGKRSGTGPGVPGSVASVARRRRRRRALLRERHRSLHRVVAPVRIGSDTPAMGRMAPAPQSADRRTHAVAHRVRRVRNDGSGRLRQACARRATRHR